MEKSRWISQEKREVDYMTINKRFINDVKQRRTYPGANCGMGCDPIPVIAVLNVKLRKVKKKQRIVSREWDELQKREVKPIFEIRYW